MLPTQALSPLIECVKTKNNLDFTFQKVDLGQVESVIKGLNPKKATGYDKIPTKLVKAALPFLGPHVTALVNQCIETSSFPQPAKYADVNPIFKKDNCLLTKNYRPVSVLPCLSKVLELVLNNQLKSFTNKILSPLISAYRAGYSCEFTLIKLIETWRQALDKGEATAAVLMDLSKAFDCLPHGLLIAKLKAYGLSTESCVLMASYLRKRLQRVKLGEFTSSFVEILKGVPQGSILGPVLFNIFLNDLVNIFNRTDLVNYADDNTITAISKRLEDCLTSLKLDGEAAVNWFTENDMKANADKFHLFIGGKHADDNASIDILGNHLEAETSAELLGIQIDSDLNFREQVSGVCRKAGLQLNALRRLSKCLSLNTRKAAFNSFVRSQFNYCPLVWGCNNATQTAKIEKIIERALRIVFNDYNSSYENLLGQAKIDSFADLQNKRLCELTYKAVHGLAPPYISDLFPIKTDVQHLRGYKRIDLPRCKGTTYGLKSLRYRGARLWNSLDKDLISSDFENFKSKLSKLNLQFNEHRF